jgi:hypothetical protein
LPKKALYRTLQAATLFWKELSGTLLLWHVDYIKISHVSPKVVRTILYLLDQKYLKEAPLVVTDGIHHDYLGMTLYFGTPGV